LKIRFFVPQNDNLSGMMKIEIAISIKKIFESRI